MRPLGIWLSITTFLGSLFKYLAGGVGDLGGDVYHNAMAGWLRKNRPELFQPPAAK